MKQSETNKQKGAERIVTKFTEQMIQTIKDLQVGWRKTWISTSANGSPMNLSGRSYNCMNEFFLYLFCEAKQFKYPVFVTLKKANELGANIAKGAESAPVLFWKIDIKNQFGKRISIDDYRLLSKAEQDLCETHPILKYYHVFNIEQTNLAEVMQDKLYKFLKENFSEPEIKSADGMYANPALDEMLDRQTWCCPITCKKQDRAFYSPSSDSITLPIKEQFNLGGSDEDVYISGQEFYSTMLHEMTHSTGSPDRLNRVKGSTFGSESYAREELVAELTAALIGHKLGFNTRVQENNAAYLSSWLKALNEDPKFLISVLADVNKAAQMIEQIVNHEEAA